MKSKHTTKTIIITTLMLLVGATIAFAHGGRGYGGYGHHMDGYGGPMKGPGYGGGPMMGYGNCPGWGKGSPNGNLSEEEAAKLEEARKKFYQDTKELRRNIKDMRIDLRDEMDKETPDTAKVLNIQKEISKLETDFDQKVVMHRMEIRKIKPDGFRGRGYGRGERCCQ